MINFKKIKENDFAITAMYLFAFLLPLNPKASTIVIFFWLAVSFNKVQVSKLVFEKKLILLPILYFTYIFSLIYTENFSFKYFEQKASLLAFPLIFYLNGYKYNTKVLNKVLYFFVIGCLLSVLLCFFYAFYSSINITDSSITFTPQVTPGLEFIESSVKGGNFFYGTHFSIFHHTTYYAMFLCFGVAILLFKDNLVKHKIVKVLFIGLLSVTIFQISSRAGVLTLFLIALFFIYNKTNSKVLFFKYGLAVLLGLSALVIFNPRLKHTAKNIFNSITTFHNEDVSSSSLRLMTWDASIDVIAENPILGVGIGDAYYSLREVYRQKRYVMPYRDLLNAHNEYFQLYLEAGIIALLVYLIVLLFLYKQTKIKNNVTNIISVFLLIIVVNSLFESILNHYSGIVFYSFFYCFFVMINREKSMIK
ncbi:O-antigen ligase [Mesoflavibacter zeaxanthinifaciens]|uniref:O-antigen ligase family protein n=1 Tax=Mesoflavibacter zeaxanthinifaciens TaxID=393060 RepID=UPI0026ECEC8E|nr:O-antigen ligase family protein [Mesoflavibacter zeaxanthinifaciens]